MIKAMEKKIRKNNINPILVVNKIKDNRIIYFDILNIIACIAVLFLHCNGGVHSFSNTRLWKECLVIEVLFYFAVPIFVMLTGATLLNYRKRYDTKTYFCKRIEKVVIPWIIWSMIVYIVHNKNLNIINFLKSFINQKIETIYWFFPLIIYLYCLIPVLSILTEKEKYRKTMWGIVGFIFIFQTILKPLCQMLNITYPNVLNYTLEPNAYIIYLLLGYLLSTTDLNKKCKISLYILSIIALFTRYLYTMSASVETGVLNKASWGYTSFTGLFPAISVFILIKDLKWNEILSRIKVNPQILSNIASCSFGVYLMHMLVKSRITNLFNINTASYFYRLIFPLILYIICITLVYAIKKIPFIKKIVP